MESTTTALTKEQLYDAIGQANIVIVDCEHRIPELEDALQSAAAETTEVAIRQSLREYRDTLADRNAEVRRHRLTLIARLEMEIENLNRDVAGISLTSRERANYEMDVHTLSKELETLRKLV